MFIAHTIGGLPTTSGGPTRSVPMLCEAINAIGVFKTILITVDKSDTKTNAARYSSLDIRLVKEKSAWSYASEFGSVFEQAPFPIIHDHGQWMASNRGAAVLSSSQQLKRVCTPRGTLSPWSFHHKGLKKRIAWTLYARRHLESASVVHATSKLECEELRLLGVRAPIAVIPNGIGVGGLKDRPRIAKGTKKFLFLSRIHRKKGIFELFEAWRMLCSPDWQLLIAGPDEQGIMRRSVLPDRCQYLGNVEGEAKERLYQLADVFLLPSHSENFGLVVGEAMLAGTPVITTTATPWSIVQKNEYGWIIEPKTDQLVTAMFTAMTTRSDVLSSMGERAREYVLENLSWAAVGRKATEMYQWLLDLRATPEFVEQR